jgi:glycosyltransferase involved in cell wall biosynthesis
VRILVVTDQWFPDLAGGSARVATETATRLAGRGHEVTVVAPRVNGRVAVTENGSLTVHRALGRGLLPQTLTDVVGTRREGLRLGRRFDLVLAHQSTTAVGATAARLGAPLALVYHASAVRELRFLRSRLRVGGRRLAAYGLELPLVAAERLAVRRAARVLVLSDFSRRLLASDHPGATPVRVRGGVDTTTFRPADGRTAARLRLGLAEDGVLLVAVRRFEPRMGLEELLGAFTRLEGAATLALVGSGLLEPRLRALASDLGVDGRVLFPGRVGDDALPDWYRAADLVVLPTVAYEGFGLATVEALACGTPVVGSPVGATPELLGPLDRRLLADSAEPGALAAAIRAGLELGGEELGRRCREHAEREYAWDAVIGDWEAALEETARA